VNDSEDDRLAPAQPTAHNRDQPTVVIALATFRRPECLERILPEVAAQAEHSAHSASVLVVDNDPAGGARAAVTRWQDRGVRYVHEPTPGISAARNRALAEAPDADLLIFVDDDELPLPGWLDQHVARWLEWRCAAIVGPVTAQLEGFASDWVRACGVFDRKTLPTGTAVPGAASNNLLLDLAQLRSHRLSFDEDFGISGGSDTRLIHQLVKDGGRVRWCDEAEVLDYIPANRSTRKWVLKRTMRTSNTWSRVALDLADGRNGRVRERFDLTVRGGYRLALGVARTVRGVVRSDLPDRARGAVQLAEAAGMLLGAYGHVEQEYRRKPGG
jgi:succinoglycan biosynthesis protein ExoM